MNCAEHEWRYPVGGLFKGRNVGHIKTEIKDKGGVFRKAIAEGRVLTKDFWNLRVYYSEGRIVQKLLEEALNFSLFLGCRKFPP